MNERAFGQHTGLRVPPVNIGSMRLPRDLDDAVRLVRHAIDSGMRYIDTSRGYGEAEWVLSRALKDGYREKVLLSTKWGPWIVKIRQDDAPTADAVRRRIEEQMQRLDVDRLDFYQVWSTSKPEHYAAAVARGGMVDGLRKAREEGLIGHIGLTTHEAVEDLLEYIGRDDWFEVILLTYNLLNRTYAPVLEAAHNKGIGTLVMNPVGGGRLAEPSPVLMALAEKVGAISVPDLAVRYVLSNPAVTTLLCGMSKTSDVDDTIASAERPPFTATEMKTIEAFLHEVSKDHAGFCTGCKYCLPCPRGIDIPAVMDCIYDDRFWGLKEGSRLRYQRLKTPKADACVQCGQCEEKCTQKLRIAEEMAYAAREYAGEQTPASASG